ncbi:hypothetical protein RYX36_013938 [Vicia faba]
MHVRRVKPEYQDVDEAGTITNVEFKNTGDISGSFDVRFGCMFQMKRLDFETKGLESRFVSLTGEANLE